MPQPMVAEGAERGSMERSDMIAADGPQGSAGRAAGALSNRSSMDVMS